MQTERLFYGRFPDIYEQSDEDLRAEIEAKFGPIPEFDQSGFSTEVIHFPDELEQMTGDTKPYFEKPNYRFEYNADKTHLRFIDTIFRDKPEAIIEYVLLDEETKTIARRALHYDTKWDKIARRHKVTDQLSTAKVSFRTPQYSQDYETLFGPNAQTTDGFSIKFNYHADFSDFWGIGNEFAIIRFGTWNKQRTDIHLPFDSLGEIQELVEEGDVTDVHSGIHLYLTKGEREDPYKNIPDAGEDIIRIAYGYNYNYLRSKKPFSPRGFSPHVLTVDHTDGKLHILWTSKRKNAEVWQLESPDYPDTQQVGLQMIGSTPEWTQLYETLPVRLNILNPKTLPS